jgi:subtilisin family serine protease
MQFRKTRKTSLPVKCLFVISAILFSGYVGADGYQTYVVLYKQHSVPENAVTIISDNGGTLVHSYDQIGVAIAKSDTPAFPASLLNEREVEGVSATAGYETHLTLGNNQGQDNELEFFDINSEPLAEFQWDMRQIQVAEAHTITRGDAAVVGVIDSGIDTTHPDLASQIDYSKSVSCEKGVPNQDPKELLDYVGHGTHVAGIIAAASNGIGITGVAPEAKLAVIKGCSTDGCYPEGIICSFMWAGDQQIAVTNNSYFVDPDMFNCHNNPEQHALWKAIRRSIKYAQSRGVSFVAAAGNGNVDLTHPETFDDELTNACSVIPVEMPLVIGVSANGNLWEKADYSNYGVGVVDVVAPGGDRRFQVTGEAVNGRVLSTFPAFIAQYFLEYIPPLASRVVEDCSNGTCAYYFYAQGTSMAAPHVTGVAALATSQHGKMSPGALQAVITSSADPVSCPENSSECKEAAGYNSFSGHGQVNALKAVTQGVK